MHPSISEVNRQNSIHQVDAQRLSILNAAEKLFLQNGLENTNMVDIAGQAGISRVTLYRYFANRDAIALEIQVRMMHKIQAVIDQGEAEFTLDGLKRQAQAMIHHFPELRDAYRYIGMFDRVYLDHAPDSPLAQWTKNQLANWDWGGPGPGDMALNHPYRNEISVIFNAIVWFLEKLALRGELTWSDQNVPLEEDLQIFETMILGYFDRLTHPVDASGG